MRRRGFFSFSVILGISLVRSGGIWYRSTCDEAENVSDPILLYYGAGFNSRWGFFLCVMILISAAWAHPKRPTDSMKRQFRLLNEERFS